MANIQIAILNQSSMVSDQEIEAAVNPLQKQIAGDFAPIWGTNADLTFIAAGSEGTVTATPACWQLVILDETDQAGTLGYHDLTPAGLPLMKVFAQAAAQDKVSWTSVASHEILEALADPYTSGTVFVPGGKSSGRIWPIEVCDPVEGDLYEIDGVEVSNFVTPQWFMAEPPSPAVFDYLGFLSKPFEVRKTGYMEYLDVQTDGKWQEIS